MTSPPDPLPDDVAVLEADLAAGDGGRLVRVARGAGRVARGVAVLVFATGAAALVLGLIAARGSTVAMVIVVVLCLPALLAPVYVARRAAALGRAAAHPREVADQARDLLARVRHSPDLHALAGRLGGASGQDGLATGGSTAGHRAGRWRAGLRLARQVSNVVGQAQPDEDRHPLLVPLSPERLRGAWTGVVVALWGWAVAAVVLVVSVPVVLVRLVA